MTDSDDSENEGCLGSVTRAVMRPPGCSGKAKRGHLCFDASYETGMLFGVKNKLNELYFLNPFNGCSYFKFLKIEIM